MDEAQGVEIDDCLDELLGDDGSLILLQERLTLHILIQIALIHQLRDNIHMRFGLRLLNEPHNTGMYAQPQDATLMLNNLLLRHGQFKLLNGLDSHLLPRLLLDALIDHRKIARPDLLLDRVLVQNRNSVSDYRYFRKPLSCRSQSACYWWVVKR